MQRLVSRDKAGFEAFNLGTERGSTVKEVIDACRRVTQIDFQYGVSARRPGDPAKLVANSARAHSELGWRPAYSLEDIVTTAWKWFSKQKVAAAAR
jgi:UDP-glucose 4-epimerase